MDIEFLVDISFSPLDFEYVVHCLIAYMFSNEKQANHHSHIFFYFFKFPCFRPSKIFKTADLKCLPFSAFAEP